MVTYDIAVLRGDGIGLEVVDQGIKVLEALQEISCVKFNFIETPAGGNEYNKNGDVLPEESLERMKKSDAILKGPVGLPDLPQGLVEAGVILKLRQELDQYINLRPMELYKELSGISPLKKNVIKGGIDYVVVRENSEGEYSKVGGIRGKMDISTQLGLMTEKMMKDQRWDAVDINVHTVDAIDRIIDYSFNLAKRRFDKKSVTLVDKANVLHGSRLWRERFDIISKSYPDIKTEKKYVDNFTQLIISPYVSELDVVVTSNLMGDIISDEGAKTIGSLGLAPGANINPNGVSMFEQIAGAAPDIAGKGIANPIGMIKACKMMVENLGEIDKAQIIEEGVQYALRKGFRTKDIKSTGTMSKVADFFYPVFGQELVSTEEMGDVIAEYVRSY
ncbi:MAG: isocitrate/isopropylmalate dehydrogenase family protein [Candidatus Aenigmatarchaeota archaeon]